MSELYELPDGWEWKTVDETYIVKDGTHDSPKYVKENGYPLYTSKNLKNNRLDTSNFKLIKEEDYQKINKRSKVDKGDLLFAMIGTIGNPTIIEFEPKFAIKNVALFKPKSDDNSIEILRYYLGSNRIIKKMINEAKGSTQKFVGLTYLRKFPFPTIPLQEQKQIVAKLDALFELIDKAIALHQQNINQADAFMGSVLNEVFEELEGRYEKRTLESFNKKISSGGTPSRKEKAYWENGTIDWFSSGELNQLYTITAKERITQLGLDKTSTRLFSKGTLLIGMYDTAAMKMSILSADGSCNQAIVGFKPDENELNIFFTKYQLEYLKKEILKQRQGVRQKNLNLTKIKNIEIEYPPLKTQQKTVAYLDQISSKIEQIKTLQSKKLQSLKDLKASLLDKAFLGELL